MENEVIIKRIWKHIELFENYYLVSNFGKIKSIKIRANSRYNKPTNLKPSTSPKGYLHIVLMVNGKSFAKTVHRLVAEAFIPNPENKPQINHIDGDKTNNSVDNLEWCTAKENKEHAIRIGLINKNSYYYGEDHPRAKLKNKEVREIKNSLRLINKNLATKYNITSKNIDDIRRGRTYKTIN